jgi:uncharacterized protein YjiS (DUF1127 family)
MTILCNDPTADSNAAIRRRLSRFLSELLVRRAHRRARRELSHLSDRLRADIGLPPQDAPHFTSPIIGLSRF